MTYNILTDDILAQTSGGKKRGNNKWLKWQCPVGTVGAAIGGGAAIGPVGFFLGSVVGSIKNCE